MIPLPTFNIELIGNIALFLIFFSLITWALRKTMFKDSKGTLIAISASASILAIYGLIKINFSIEKILTNLNFSGALQYNIIIILIIIALIFLWKKIGLGMTLIILGIILFLAGILNLVYANASIGIIGAVLIIIGLAIRKYSKHQKELKNLNLKERQEYKRNK
jgi:hypothetical protein